jgi:hypothetical protein
MTIKSIFHDDIFYVYSKIIVNGQELTPIYVTGYYGYPWLNGWSGVGPSPAIYKMKAYQDTDGTIYRPPSDYERQPMIRVNNIPAHAIIVNPPSQYHTRLNQTYNA